MRLSEIGRSLDEGITLHKMITWLANQLKRPGLLEHLEKWIIGEGALRVHQETLLIIDVSDSVKPYAEKMQDMARVRDGSSGSIESGYWTMQVVGVEAGGNEMPPLYHERYSQDCPDFKSENHQIEKAIETVSSQVQDKGIWRIDRSGDRRKLFNFLLHTKKRFIIKLVGNRHILYRGKKVAAGVGKQLLMLLTTERLENKRQRLWWVIEAYLTRWRIEETIRFVEQRYRLEDIRVLTYERLRNMMGLVLAA